MDTIKETPRFHKIGSSKNNLIVVVKKDAVELGKKTHTSKNVSKFKRESKSSNNSKTKKRSKSIKIKKNDLNSFLKAINMKKKFLLRNDFDKKHAKEFLKEKKLMLEKPFLIDEIQN